MPSDSRRGGPARLGAPDLRARRRRSVVQSWWTIVAGICLGLAGAVLALERIPQKYEATARIWTDQPEPLARVSSTRDPEQMSRRLTRLTAVLLRDEVMVELIKRTYGLPEHDEALPGLIAEVRDRISLTTGSSRRRGREVLELRFRDADPERAALTVNTLAELHLVRDADESAAITPRQATDTLEAAVVPTVPHSPKRVRVYAVFLTLGCLLFPGPVVVRGLMHRVISSEEGFRRLSKIPVMGSIPVAAAEQSRRSARQRLVKNVILSMLSCAILLSAIVLRGTG